MALATAAGCGSKDLGSNDGPHDAGGDVDAGGPVVTCGVVGALCGGDQWCSYATAGSCGKAGVTGTCTARPTMCPNTCPGVCGCDGHVYCNTCEAQRAGSDVMTGRTCLPQTGEYTAYSLFTDVPRIVIFKSDTERNVCFRVQLVMTNTPQPTQITVPPGWGIERSEITNDAADCALTNAGYPVVPAGTTLGSSGGSGQILFLGGPDGGASLDNPCALTVHARLAFQPGDFRWVPATEPLDYENLKIGGSCR